MPAPRRPGRDWVYEIKHDGFRVIKLGNLKQIAWSEWSRLRAPSGNGI
jgi:hypothetical protein